MIDSVLKGTGNSRFLKSAVPAGTSWADALAMLQAGTFPIDLNGINNAGFQQVGTPLNKANLLKDATAAQIGLPPSTTPDGMFRALGNTGELHVWRKTVKTSSDTPAGYTLGAAQSNLHVPTSGQTVDFVYSASITVGNDGTVSQPSSGTKRAFATSAYVSAVQSVLAGKFFTVKNDYGSVIDGVWYCPSSLTVSVSGNDIILSQAQKVNAHGIIPAGTTTTYPVSTNPNVYQEGDDAKEAGYTLGATQKNVQILSGGDNWHTTLYYADSVVVDDEGKLSLQSPNSYTFATSSQYQNVSTFAIGRFIKIVPESGSGFSFMDGIWFVPSDSTITVENFKLYSSKIQPVTGYPAIPAGTTIEYLGKLGDKARVQFGSYVGTGTYGSSNPNTLTFDFVPKMVFVWGFGNSSGNSLYYQFMFYGENYTSVYIGDGNDRSTKVSWDSKTVSWYTGDRYKQLNESSRTYRFFAIC